MNKQNAILKWLKAGHVLTTATAWELFHTMDLRHYISELKRSGVKIKKEWRQTDKSRFKIYKILK